MSVQKNIPKKDDYTEVCKEPFAAAMYHLMRRQDVTNDELGLKVGYKNGKMIDAIRHERSSGSEKKRRLIAEFFGYTYDAFLDLGEEIIKAGGTPLISPKNDLHEYKTKKNANHHKIVDEFPNPEAAEDVNMRLLNIIRKDEKVFQEIHEYVKWKESMLNEKAASPPKDTGTGPNE